MQCLEDNTHGSYYIITGHIKGESVNLIIIVIE